MSNELEIFKTTLSPSGVPTYSYAVPQHNKDFCHLCRQCLHCVGRQLCMGSESYRQAHFWLDNSAVHTRKEKSKQ